MNITMEKSANQRYRESGSSLPFKDWIEREKAKGVHIPNIEANEAMLNAIGQEEASVPKEKDNRKTMLHNIIFTATLIFAVVAIVKVLKADTK